MQLNNLNKKGLLMKTLIKGWLFGIGFTIAIVSVILWLYWFLSMMSESETITLRGVPL